MFFAWLIVFVRVLFTLVAGALVQGDRRRSRRRSVGLVVERIGVR